MILGDGDPGLTAADYYGADAGVPGELPKQLLDQVKAAGIALHTLCVGGACPLNIVRYSDWLHSFFEVCPVPSWYGIGSHRCVAARGGDLMRDLAEYTRANGGACHGYYQVPRLASLAGGASWNPAPYLIRDLILMISQRGCAWA